MNQKNNKSTLNKSPDGLRFLMAYWCAQVSPLHVDRFEWSTEIMGSMNFRNTERAARTVVSLASCAPEKNSEELLSFFAAGDPEDLINEIVDSKDKLSAAILVRSPAVEPLLKWVWTEERVAILRKLARQYGGQTEDANTYLPKFEASYTINQLAAFWCDVHSSLFISNFSEEGYIVDNYCRDITNPNIAHDLEHLLLSSPDDKAVEETVTPIISGLFYSDVEVSPTELAMLKESDLLRPYVERAVEEKSRIERQMNGDDETEE
jgi:hypothetical protein